VDLDQIRSKLEAAGAEIEMLKAGDSRALVVRRVPKEARVESVSGQGSLWIVEGEVSPLLEGGAAVAESGTLVLGAERIPVLRVSDSGLRPLGVKAPEGPGNLKGRAGWFGKRSGPEI
jgi:hypothetical protein